MLRRFINWLLGRGYGFEPFWYQRALYDAFEREDRRWKEYLAQRAAETQEAGQK